VIKNPSRSELWPLHLRKKISDVGGSDQRGNETGLGANSWTGNPGGIEKEYNTPTLRGGESLNNGWESAQEKGGERYDSGFNGDASLGSERLSRGKGEGAERRERWATTVKKGAVVTPTVPWKGKHRNRSAGRLLEGVIQGILRKGGKKNFFERRAG